MISRRSICLSSLLFLVNKKSLAKSFGQDTNEVDVLVVGSGGAGLCAAVSALQNGANKVMLIEKGFTIGGHTISSSGTVAAVWPKYQLKQGISDSPELMTEQMLEIGKINDPEIVLTLASKSGEALEWMASLGLHWRTSVGSIYGCPHLRGFKSLSPRSGYDYVEVPLKAFKRLGGMIRYNTRLIDIKPAHVNLGYRAIVLCNGRSDEIKAKAIVLATGGFTANPVMLEKYAPGVTTGLPSNFNPSKLLFDGSTGDAVLLAEKKGFALENMSSVQCIPMLGGRTILETGLDIFLDPSGERFVREGCSWNELRRAIESIPQKFYWVLTPHHGQETENIEYKLLTGALQDVNSYDELSMVMNVPPDKLKKTVTDYNDAVYRRRKDPIGLSKNAMPLSGPPFYIGKERLGVQATLGGLKIDKFARVIDLNGNVVDGIFAAGEVASGVHGLDKMAGTSMTANFVFGRIAGEQAAKYAKGTYIR